MKLPCEMMEDLLPLYAEDIATNATRQAVEEHLAECEPCRTKLDGMRAERHEGETTIPLEPVRKEIRKRRWHAVIAAACAVAVVLVTVLSWQNGMIYLPYSACEITVETQEDGSGTIHYLGPNGMREWMMDDILYVAPVSSRYQSGGGEIVTSLNGEKAVYFVDATKHGATTLIWAKSPAEANGVAQVLPRLALGYYLVIALVTAVILLAAWYPLRRRRIGRAAKQLGVLALCYAVAHFLVMGTISMSFNMIRDFGFIVAITLLLWGLAISGEQLIREMRRDRK